MTRIVSALFFGFHVGLIAAHIGEMHQSNEPIGYGHLLVLIVLTGGFWMLGYCSHAEAQEGRDE